MRYRRVEIFVRYFEGLNDIYLFMFSMEMAIWDVPDWVMYAFEYVNFNEAIFEI